MKQSLQRRLNALERVFGSVEVDREIDAQLDLADDMIQEMADSDPYWSVEGLREELREEVKEMHRIGLDAYYARCARELGVSVELLRDPEQFAAWSAEQDAKYESWRAEHLINQRVWIAGVEHRGDGVVLDRDGQPSRDESGNLIYNESMRTHRVM